MSDDDDGLPVAVGEYDSTETARRALLEGRAPYDIVARAQADGERVWTTDELCAEFEVIGFLAPLVVVRRRSDGARGTLWFQHSPRLYASWREDSL
jgi:hypothetical protein